MIDDPIGLALVQKQLDHIARQMGWVMMRTARSPIFSQSHDFSCFIGDAQGNVVSQADGLPIHTGGGGFAIRAVLDSFQSEIADGDVFILSDPYEAGGNHLPDWTIVRPVFVRGEVIAFCCNRAHQSDIGGGAAGTYNPAATEIFHEGIRLPVLRLVDAGTTRRDLWRLLLLNSRCPDLLDGDLRAMIGSTEIGAARVADALTALPAETVVDYLQGILGYAERLVLDEIGRLPCGEYQGEDESDQHLFQRLSRRHFLPGATFAEERRRIPADHGAGSPGDRRQCPAPGADDDEYGISGNQHRSRLLEGAGRLRSATCLCGMGQVAALRHLGTDAARSRRCAGFDCRTSKPMSNYIRSRSENTKCAGMAKAPANSAADPASTISRMSTPRLNGHFAARAPMA